VKVVRLPSAWVLALCVAAGCSGPTPGPCPPLRLYTQAENERLAAELERLPDDAITVDVVADYMALRDQLKACQ
jgi:hypothetical protein